MPRICPRSHTHYCNEIGPAEYDPQFCYPCWCWFYRRDVRVSWGGPHDAPPLPDGPEPRSVALPAPATQIAVITLPMPTRSECPYLGAVVSFCTTCSNPDVQAFRNVHRCEHPEHAEEMGSEGLVTRGQHCETCTYFPSVDSSV